MTSLFASQRIHWLPGTCAGLLILTTLATSGAQGGLNDRDDGGAAVYSSAKQKDAALISKSDDLAKFPIAQRARIHVLGGAVRGFGMLALYGSSGPGQVEVSRRTQTGKNEPYVPVALARVYDPQGNLVAIEDFSDQKDGTDTRVLSFPGKEGAGIWRVSFSGGRAGDLVEIRLPQTEYWGVRGEAALGVTSVTPRPAYLWVAPSSQKMLVGIETGKAEGFTVTDASGQNVLGQVERDTLKRSGRITIKTPPRGEVCRLTIPPAFEGAMVLEGTPPLLCPSKEAAERLKGGAVESQGLWTSGPLQARAREWMVANAPKIDRNITFTFPKEIPADLTNLDRHVLAFSKYGPLNNLKAMVDAQNANLDSSKPLFGSCVKFDSKITDSWPNFLPPRMQTFFPSGMSAAVIFDSPLNPAYKSDDLTLRATIALLYQIETLPGDELLREPGSSFFTSRYPMINAFLIFAGTTEALRNLEAIAQPDARAILNEGVMAIGDKLADYQSYQSNQWTHVFSGHLNIYRATGEKRFLRYFERAATAYLDNVFGPDSKFGLHPTGFFLEENGPDGNYDNLNSFYVVSSYLDYRELPEAKPELVEKFRAGIEKNLRFRSFFWLPQPGGDPSSPNAFNCRTEGNLAGAGYPGAMMARSEFPLGAARFALTPAPRKNIGGAGTFSFVANTPEWIRATIEEGLRKGASGYTNISYGWLPMIEHAYALPRKVASARLPIEETDKTWTLPGLLAWNRNGIYGVTLYDVAGTKHELKGFLGGGPSALWTPSTGSFLSGRAPRHPDYSPLPDAKSLSFACVFGEDNSGGLYYSGKERTELKTLEEGVAYETTATLSNPAGALQWGYQMKEKELQLSVRWNPSATVRTRFLNLPIAKKEGVRTELTGPGQLTIHSPSESIVFTWPTSAAGKLEESVEENVTRLVIPLPADGSALTVRIAAAPSVTNSTMGAIK